MTNINTNDKIISYYINGLSRSEIAEKANVATGTVSKRIREYEQKSNLDDLNEIRKGMKEVRKSGLTIKVCSSV